MINYDKIQKNFINKGMSALTEPLYDKIINEKVALYSASAIKTWGLTVENLPQQGLIILKAPYFGNFASERAQISQTKNNNLLSSNYQITIMLTSDFDLFFYRSTFSIISPVFCEISAVYSYKHIVSLLTAEGVAKYYSENSKSNHFYCAEHACMITTLDGGKTDFYISGDEQSRKIVADLRKHIFIKKANM